MKCCCYGCNKRYVGCHSECDDYQEWNRKHLESKEKLNEAEIHIMENSCKINKYMQGKKQRRGGSGRW